MPNSLFEEEDLAKANKAVPQSRPKPLRRGGQDNPTPPPASASPSTVPTNRPAAPQTPVVDSTSDSTPIRPDRVVTLKVESAKGMNSTFFSRFKASLDAKEVLEHAEGASRAEGNTQNLAEVHALIEVLAQIEVLFPEGTTEVHAALPPGLGGFAKANLPTYDRMGFLDEDQSRAEAVFNGQMKNPVPEAARPSYRRLAAALRRQPIILNW